MNIKLRKTVSLAVTQALIACSLPLAAMASETESPVFLLPLNPAIEVGVQPIAQPGLPLTESVEKTVLEVEDILGEETVVAEETPIAEEVDVIVIDNDETGATVEEVQWQEIKDEPGMTKIAAGARFPVAIMSSLSSKTAKEGDPVEGRLKVDINIGGREVAHKGDVVIGHISSCARARRMLHAELSPKRWMRASGCLGLTFDEIITRDGEHLPLVAKPAFIRRVVENKNDGRVLGVNHKGELASPLSTQLKHQAVHLAIRGAASAGGVFSMGAVPAAYGIIGAINPSFAFLQPVGKNVPHRRLKGFAMGVVSGMPGGFLVADMIIKGKEAVIKPGDIYLAEFKQEFTGEAASSATLIPGAKSKVHGEVMEDKAK
ncbi:MAG: hypothetical protein AB7V06_17660 [Candidatus Obscuribacterales bacterium]